MQLRVDRVGDTPSEQRFEVDRAWWQEACALIPELDAEDAEPPRFNLFAHRMGDDLYLEGSVEGSLPFTCGRCLKRYRHALRERFRLVLEPAGDRVPADPEGAASLERDGLWLGDELESGWFRGKVLDLGAYLRELVSLALPVQPLCREDCRGLCPRCGRDRNLESCDCSETISQSPFAALGALRGDPSKGRD